MVEIGIIVAGVGATLVGGSGQLVFAVICILGVGMLHGLGDLSAVGHGSRRSFLLSYAAVVIAVLAVWRFNPVVALATFLAASMLHFGLDDAPVSRPAERMCRGLSMVSIPALLHAPALARLFSQLGVAPAGAEHLAMLLRVIAVIALGMLAVALAERRREHARGTASLVGALAALVMLPPLVGFAVGFIVLHAGPQLRARLYETSSGSVTQYLRMHWLIALGASLVLAAAAWLLADRTSPPVAMLFAGVAALALPHMALTPLWSLEVSLPS